MQAQPIGTEIDRKQGNIQKLMWEFDTVRELLLKMTEMSGPVNGIEKN